ncbi:Fumarylacetoacetate hydrolase family protein [plant metagenome]|uniref:Fumarylacetoacetate hydrolase family protein n=1 Tax=plant metagenome TaxID=1297885 RepID=A0A484PDI3_9ZZZZ
MKVALFERADGTRSIGEVHGDEIHDLGEWVGSNHGCLLAAYLSRVAQVPKPVSPPKLLTLHSVRLLPPALGATAIYCVGVNYAAHARSVAERTGTEFDPSASPALFMKTWTALTGHDTPIIRPRVSDWFDFEGELVVIIGLPCRAVHRKDALRYVAGYSIGIDGSVRDWQRKLPTPTAGKNFAKSGSMGPWMVTADEISDPAKLRVITRLDGQVFQDAPTSELINDVAALIEHISTFTTLMPGDVIFTGTPAGCLADRGNDRWLKPGELVTVEIPGIGTLSNIVADEPA